jgi:hypothetical protein
MSKFRRAQIPGYSRNLRYVKIIHHRFVPHNFNFSWRHIKLSPVLLITFTVQGTLSNELKRWYLHVNLKNIWEELHTSFKYMLYKSNFCDSPVRTIAHLLRTQNYWLKASLIKNKLSRIMYSFHACFSQKWLHRRNCPTNKKYRLFSLYQITQWVFRKWLWCKFHIHVYYFSWLPYRM